MMTAKPTSIQNDGASEPADSALATMRCDVCTARDFFRVIAMIGGEAFSTRSELQPQMIKPAALMAGYSACPPISSTGEHFYDKA